MLSVANSTFEDIDLMGICSNMAQSVIDSSSFINCETYGIWFYYTPTYPSLDSSIITGSTIRTGEDEILGDSQYGIRVNGLDKLRIEGNNIRTYKLGGIYLDNSDAIVLDNDVSYCTNYGIYSTSSSNGLISYCAFDSLSNGLQLVNNSNNTINHCDFGLVNIGVLIYGDMQPDLGDSAMGDTLEWGNCDFEHCVTYYIQQIASYKPGPLIKAEMNYFNVANPGAKMSGNIDYTPYRTTPPFAKALAGLELPEAYGLSDNYPNPFNPTTTISYSLATSGHTTVDIYNILGQKITSLVSQYQEAGKHSVIWNGRNESGDMVASGVYFYRLISGDFIDSKKMLFLR